MSGGAEPCRTRLHLVPQDPEAPVEGATPTRQHLDSLVLRVAKGDDGAFAELYDALAPAVFGLARRVLRQTEHAEEVAQEVLLEVWQQAPRFDPRRGTGFAWVMTMAHRRAVDRVRSAQAASDRDLRVVERSHVREHDEVAEAVEQRLEGRSGSRVHRHPHRAAARVGDAGLLRRLHVPRGGRAARGSAWHDQDADA